MREDTYNNVLDWRIDLAEQYLVPHFLGKSQFVTHRVQLKDNEELTVD